MPQMRALESARSQGNDPRVRGGLPLADRIFAAALNRLDRPEAATGD
jgi:hypothetical protein